MDVVSPRVIRVLRYIGELAGVGYAPTSDEVEAYAVAPDPLESNGVNDFLWDYLEQVQDSVESATSHMSRLRWLRVTEGRIAITELGRAVLLAQQESPTSSENFLEATVDPSDTFAYAKLLGRLSTLEDALMVDPYIDQLQLIDLARLPQMRRVLTSLPGRSALEKDSRKARLALVMDKVTQPLELRVAPAGVLHDRVVIPDLGRVVQLSSSLNSVTERVSIVTTVGAEVSTTLRDHYNNIWKNAEVLDGLTATSD